MTPSAEPSATASSSSDEAASAIAEVRIERDGPIGWLVFDHQARRNAMTLAMWQQVPGLCAELDAAHDIRVVVMRGAGDRAFVAGADISQFTTERTPERAGVYNDATAEASRAIRSIQKPVVAMIQGFCIGGGLALALAADIRYGAAGSRFALPPAKLGIGYGADGIADLVDLVGPSVTKEIIFTADLFDSERAVRWGLLNESFPQDELLEAVRSQAKTMASRAPLSQAAAKLAVQDHLEGGHHAPGKAVVKIITACMESADYQEGVAAFLDKRIPQFRGA